MPAAAIGAAVTLYTANQQKNAAKGAANTMQRASDAATAEQARQYDQTRTDNMPWLVAGQNALARQRALLEGDYSGFESSPDYLYARQEMTQAGDRSAAARGGLYSGGYQADLAERIGGLASQNLNSYWNKLAGQAGQGQMTASGLAQAGQNYANAVSNNLIGAANARASSYQARADANSQLAGSIGNTFGQWYGSNVANNGGGTGWYLGNNPGRG
jgi:hypothetical protein